MPAMEYGKAFTYLSQEKEWIQKLLIAALMPLIPIVGPLLLVGYALEITRRVSAGEASVLPDWNHFGDYLKKGFFEIIVRLVYALPVIISAACLNVPAGVLIENEDSALQIVGYVLAACGGCLLTLTLTWFALLLPAATARLAATGQLGAAFHVGEVFELVRTKPGVYIILTLLLIVAGTILVPLGLLACGVGVLVAAAFIHLASAHLYGQAYRVAAAEAGLT